MKSEKPLTIDLESLKKYAVPIILIVVALIGAYMAASAGKQVYAVGVEDSTTIDWVKILTGGLGSIVSYILSTSWFNKFAKPSAKVALGYAAGLATYYPAGTPHGDYVRLIAKDIGNDIGTEMMPKISVVPPVTP